MSRKCESWTGQKAETSRLSLTLPPPSDKMCAYVLTFDFVSCSSTDLSFTVLQKILKGWDQIVLGDLWPNCFLELHSEKRKP